MSKALSFPDALPILRGDEVCLRELTEADIPAWFERATDAESADLAGDPIPGSIDEGTAWLSRQRDHFGRQAALRWAIVPKGGTASVGTVGLTFSMQDARIAKFGIVIARASWGKGLGTSSARMVRDYAFGTLGLRELHAEALQRNLRSTRLLQKVGFQLLRTIPASPESEGDSEDCVFYVLPNPGQRAA